MTNKTAVAVLQKQLVERGHGKHIFAYNNIQTNQVVYSLDRSMKNHACLNQLSYAGKNTVPTQLRKDYWRPFWSVTFPSSQQGLSAYRKLREWKQLHEVSWDRKDLPELDFSEDEKKQRAKLKEKWEKDGYPRAGGRRPRLTEMDKRKRKMVMDQKANSIADLAAVLIEQDGLGAKLEGQGRKTEKEQEQQERTLKEMQRLAEADTDETLAELDQKIAAAEEQRNGIPSSQDEETKLARRRLDNSIQQLQLKRAKVVAVASLIEQAETEAIARHEKSQKNNVSKTDDTAEEAIDIEIDLPQIFKDKLPSLSVFHSKKDKKPEVSPKLSLPKRGKARKQILQQMYPTPQYTSEGVMVRWSNPLDAEYAETWPRNVQHDILGLLRNTSLKPGNEAIDKVEDIPYLPLSTGKWKQLNPEEVVEMEAVAASEQEGSQEFVADEASKGPGGGQEVRQTA